MSSENIATLTKMIEALPDATQELVVEHVREYLEDLRDELAWDASFDRSQPQLVEAARRARREIDEGLQRPMNQDDL
jgi:hypothetical protein